MSISPICSKLIDVGEVVRFRNNYQEYSTVYHHGCFMFIRKQTTQSQRIFIVSRTVTAVPIAKLHVKR